MRPPDPSETANAPPSETANAKINLYLHITGRRDDGYHLLDSLAVFAEIADRLRVVPDRRLRLSLCGPFAPHLRADDDENLVLRAARALAGRGGAAGAAGAHLTLEKHLPVASGIGGGSADAAACLRLLGRFWPMPALDAAARLELAASLGADVPVCLARRPARMRGVGEILHEAPGLPDIGLTLVNCGAAISTRAVFGARDAPFSRAAELPRSWPDAASMAATLAPLSNDLEAPAMKLCPEIGAVLAALRALPGCRLARMSGSGATCFALFDDPPAARAASHGAVLPAHWWVWSGGLYQNG